MISSQLWLLLSPPSGHEIHPVYRRWKRGTFSLLETNIDP